MTFWPKRRWFAFSLRTFFVVVTLIAVVVGWSYQKSRERERYLAAIRSRPRLSGGLTLGYRSPKPIRWLTPAAWFRPVTAIALDHRIVSQAEAEELMRLFPEAHVYFMMFL